MIGHAYDAGLSSLGGEHVLAVELVAIEQQFRLVGLTDTKNALHDRPCYVIRSFDPASDSSLNRICKSIAAFGYAFAGFAVSHSSLNE